MFDQGSARISSTCRIFFVVILLIFPLRFYASPRQPVQIICSGRPLSEDLLPYTLSIDELVSSGDNIRQMSYESHSLHPLLPTQSNNKVLNYLRNRVHSYLLPQIESTLFKNIILIGICYLIFSVLRVLQLVFSLLFNYVFRPTVIAVHLYLSTYLSDYVVSSFWVTNHP